MKAELSLEEKINLLFDLAELIRSLKLSEFDMTTWVDKINPRSKFKITRVIQDKCKACIGGWATTIHPDLTIRIYEDNMTYLYNRRHNCYDGEAFEKAFGIGFLLADDLVCAEAPHKKPKEAADAIERIATKIADYHGFDVVEVPA